MLCHQTAEEVGKTDLKEGFELGEWQVWPGKNELSSNGQVIRLEQKVMRLLTFLVANAGRELSKEEIIQGVWGDGVHNEEVLTVAVSSLRKALGDNSRAPQFIKTIPRYGYLMLQGSEAVPASTEGRLKMLEEKVGLRFLIIAGLVAMLLFVVFVQVLVEIVYFLTR